MNTLWNWKILDDDYIVTAAGFNGYDGEKLDYNQD